MGFDWQSAAGFFIGEVVPMTYPVTGEPTERLPLAKNGDCGFLILGVCSIYKHRPEMCRVFDSRRYVKMFTRNVRRRLVKSGTVSRALVERGIELSRSK